MAGRDVVAELAVNLTLETASFASGASIAETRAKTMEGRLSKLGGAASKATGAIGGMAAGFALGLGTAVVAGAGAAIASSFEYASSLGEVAQQLGVTTKELQSYRYAATQAGIEQGTMDQSLAKLTKNIGLAAGGNKAAAKTFADLGISLKNADGSFLTAGQAIPLIAEKLKGVANPAEKAAILTKLFGKAGQQLLPLLGDGAKGVDELAGAAEKLGIIISDEQIARADEAADKFAALKQVLSAKIAIGTIEGYEALENLDKAIAGVQETTSGWVRSGVQAIRTGVETTAKYIRILRDTFAGLPAAVGGALANMVGQVGTYLGGRLTAIIEGAKQKVEQLRQYFFNLWDKVTRRSYIPDMVDDISREMDRLGPEMVDKAASATAKAGDKFKALQQETKDLFNELFPEMQALADFQQKMGIIDAQQRSGKWSAGFADEARRRLRGIEETPISINDNGPLVAANDDIQEELEQLLPKLQGLGDGADKLGERWEQAGYAVLNLVQGLFGNSKGGRIFGALLQGGLEIAGAFGAFKKFGGARAKGGPVVPGRTYLVGEEGPEFATFGRRGYITPNKQNASTRLTIVPSRYFDAVVDQRAAGVAAPISQAAATTAAASGMSATRRQAGRRIP